MRQTFVAENRTTYRITCSIGIATLGAEGENLDSFLARADAAMYAAKRAGKDRIVVAAGLEPPAGATSTIRRACSAPAATAPSVVGPMVI